MSESRDYILNLTTGSTYRNVVFPLLLLLLLFSTLLSQKVEWTLRACSPFPLHMESNFCEVLGTSRAAWRFSSLGEREGRYLLSSLLRPLFRLKAPKALRQYSSAHLRVIQGRGQVSGRQVIAPGENSQISLGMTGLWKQQGPADTGC